MSFCLFEAGDPYLASPEASSEEIWWSVICTQVPLAGSRTLLKRAGIAMPRMSEGVVREMLDFSNCGPRSFKSISLRILAGRSGTGGGAE
eukprot:2983110-Rhodomonas_salina.2